MAQDPKVVADKRTKLGTAESRRLRRQGVVPMIIYGHGEGSLAASAHVEALRPILQSGHQIIDIEIAGEMQKTIIRDVQWDTFGMQIQHVDLVRVSADEELEVEVPIELHGVAPGASAGGVLEHLMRTVNAICKASQIPDAIVVNINELQIHDAVHVRDLELPDGVKVQDPPDMAVVQVIEPIEVPEVEEGEEAAPTEPELVGEEKDEGEEEGGETEEG